MPKFELKEKDTNVIGKATFDKESDYVVITLNDDKLKTPHLVHKLHAKKLVDKKLAVVSKDVAVESRELETVQTPAPKDK